MRLFLLKKTHSANANFVLCLILSTMRPLFENNLDLNRIGIAPTIIASVINLTFLAVSGALAARPAVALKFSVTTTDLQGVINGYALAAFLRVSHQRADLLATKIRPLMEAAFAGLASLIDSAPGSRAE